MIQAIAGLALTVFLSNGFACAAGRARVPIDPITDGSLLDGDVTSLVEGCGNQPAVGFTYCRVQEGQAADQSLWFLGPPAQCDQPESCVFIKVWSSGGQLIWGTSIPKGQTRIEVPWKLLLGRDKFERADRGFWTFNTEVFFKDQDGRERFAKSQGDIVLRVYRAGYLPLNAIESDPAFLWSWIDGKCSFKMTSGLRTFSKCSR